MDGSVLVTGSSGRLGAALVQRLRALGRPVRGIDLRPGPATDATGSITDPGFVRSALAGATALLHTAPLHKPQLATHTRQDFLDVNVGGTLQLLEAAVAAGVQAVVCTSTTSSYGDALQPAAGAPAVWVDEALQPRPKNIYGVSKLAAEALCALLHRQHGLPCLVLRTSRFFDEADAGVATTEFLHRRVALDDAVEAHLLALQAAPRLGFARFVVSATPPFGRDDAAAARQDLAALLDRRVPAWRATYQARGWTLPAGLERVYDNAAARAALGWQPRQDFAARLRHHAP